MDISIIVPLYNEDESLPHLAEWIDRVMEEHHFDYEVIMVDDGSKDNSWQVIEQLHAKNERYKGVKFRRNYGKSAALNVGFGKAEGDVVITMDADLQDSPDEVPELYRMIKEEGYDVINYSSKSYLENVWDLDEYKTWLAHYTVNTNYAGEYLIWQFTSSGIIPGVKEPLDVNFYYNK